MCDCEEPEWENTRERQKRVGIPNVSCAGRDSCDPAVGTRTPLRTALSHFTVLVSRWSRVSKVRSLTKSAAIYLAAYLSPPRPLLGAYLTAYFGVVFRS